MLTEKFDTTGKVTYGPSQIVGDGASYRVTIDYIYSDTINRRVFIKKTMLRSRDRYDYEKRTIMGRVPVAIGSTSDPYLVAGSEEYAVTTSPPLAQRVVSPGEIEPIERAIERGEEYSEFNIPVYVGLGLRVSANIYSVKGTANISGLGIIGTEAEADNLKGSMVIQTLGVNGKSVTAALPIQSELNRTTAQNAIVAISSIKALLHSEETWIKPRIVGLYLPFPGGKPLVNALISEFSKEELLWEYNCLPMKTTAPKK
jgi:hypothetical protein